MTILPLTRASFRPKALCYIDEYLALSSYQSLAVCICHQGKAYFFTNEGEPDTLQYDLGSLSKTVSAHLILSLAQQGLVDLQETADRYLPLKKGHYPTLYQLLTHTAGYGPLTPIEITLPALARRSYSRANPYETCTSSQVLSCLNRRRRKRKDRYSYSDFSYAVLALVAQEVTDTSFAHLLEEFLHQTLQLTHTHWHAEEATRRPLAVHKGKPIPFWRWRQECPYLASGGLISTPEDVLRYMLIELESPLPFILAAQEPCRELLGKTKGLLPCVGWRSYQKSHRLWHVGGVGTFRSSVILNRQKQFGVAVLGNAKGKNRANVHHLAKLLYSELKVKKITFPEEEEKHTR